MRKTANIFKALSDETRLLMIALLLKYKELCVCAFEDGLKISQSQSSRHLKALYTSGLIHQQKKGTWVYYSITNELSRKHKHLYQFLSTLHDSEEFRKAEVKLKRFICELEGVL
jgi:ArsR family transcriptional regulator, arsenate/arsenite/antimonite-responsive transcriptional repressor